MDNQNQTNDTLPVAPQQNQPSGLEPEKPLTKAEKLKRTFFHVLITCLVASAAIAVIAILSGSLDEILGRSLGTIAMVALHAILSLGFITETEKEDKKDGGRSIELFSNTIFVLIVLSFITSIFAIWEILSGTLSFRLYLAYIVMLFATLHADVLYRIRRFEASIDTMVAVNYVLMTTVVLMLWAVIFVSDPSDLGEFFYRLLAAAGIVDATLTITAIIMHKLYMQKHPELAAQAAQATSAQSKNFWKNPLVVLLLIFLAFQVVGSIFALLFRSFA